MINFGGVPAGAVLPVFFSTYGKTNGESITLTGLAVTDVEIYKGTSMTQRASDAGYVLIDTDGIDVDSITGIHAFSIDTGDNTDSGFYAVGSFFTVVVSAVTIDSQTVNFIAATFRILAAESSAGVAKVDVSHNAGTAITSAAGIQEVKVASIAANAITATAINADAITDAKVASDVTIASVTGAVGSVTGAVGSVTGAVGSVAAGGITAASFAANAINASKLDPDVTTELQAGLATAAALATVDGIVDDILLDTAEIGTAGAGLTNINLPNQTMDIVGNITGNLSGSVGSVTGAVGSVTGAVGSVAAGGITAASFAANAITAAILDPDVTTELQAGLATAAALATVDGIVDDILLDTAEIGTAGAGLTNINLPNQTMDIVGNITGNLSGSVGSVSGAVGSVTGAVGSVTGNVGGTINGLTATALKDFFDTDSTTTYASAVAGSVVKEIADNAGGSALTAAAIADAVWDEDATGHQTTGTFGQAIGDPVADTNTIYAAVVTGAAGATVAADIIAVKAETASILADTVEIGTAGAGLTNINLPNQTMDIVGNITGNLSGSVGSVSGAVGSVTGAVGSVAAAGITAASFGANAITAAKLDPDVTTELQTGLATQVSVDDLPTNAELATALGTADDAVLAQVALVKAKTDLIPAAPAAVGDVPTAVQNADALLNRDLSTGTDSGSTTVRTPRQALRFLRNKWSISGSTLTVTKEDDATASWTASMTGTAGADPITASDPAGP